VYQPFDGFQEIVIGHALGPEREQQSGGIAQMPLLNPIRKAGTHKRDGEHGGASCSPSMIPIESVMFDWEMTCHHTRDVRSVDVFSVKRFLLSWG
jgi:hypothetical protein